jgi:hypothetical protein
MIYPLLVEIEKTWKSREIKLNRFIGKGGSLSKVALKPGQKNRFSSE